jgi:hypothetical protein
VNNYNNTDIKIIKKCNRNKININNYYKNIIINKNNIIWLHKNIHIYKNNMKINKEIYKNIYNKN